MSVPINRMRSEVTDSTRWRPTQFATDGRLAHLIHRQQPTCIGS
jgi:hypothetical protein